MRKMRKIYHILFQRFCNAKKRICLCDEKHLKMLNGFCECENRISYQKPKPKTTKQNKTKNKQLIIVHK